MSKIRIKKKVDEKHEAAVRRGKNAKKKGASYERTIADKFKSMFGLSLKRTPQSGGFAKTNSKAADFRGDVTLVDEDKEFMLHIECKSHKVWKIPKWITQAESDCPKDRIPLLVFHKYNSSEDYAVCKFNDFFGLLKEPYIVEEVDSIDVEDEEWREVKGFPNYSVSNLGRVKSVNKVLKPCAGDNGYLNVVLRKDNKSYTKRVHKLVAEAFLKKPKVMLIVNHRDGNKANCQVTNLEYTTYTGNLKHAYSHGLNKIGDRAKIDSISVYALRRDILYGIPYKDLEVKYSVSNATVSRHSSQEYRNSFGLFMYCKNCKTWSLPKWLQQAQSDCPKGRVPLVVFHKFNTSQDYVCLRLEDLFYLMDETKIVRERNV